MASPPMLELKPHSPSDGGPTGDSISQTYHDLLERPPVKRAPTGDSSEDGVKLDKFGQPKKKRKQVRGSDWVAACGGPT